MMGCTTKMMEYNILPTMKTRIIVTTTTTNPQIRISISSAVRRCFGWSLNLFLQNGGYKIFRTSLRELTPRFLAFGLVEVVGVLAGIAINIVASSEKNKKHANE